MYAKTVPAAGGDTVFANQYLAFETLSDGLQRTLRGLRAIHIAVNDCPNDYRLMHRLQVAGDRPQ